jgi:putative two-component system response regulator
MNASVLTRGAQADTGCVLLVDDEPAVRRALRRMLEGSGHRVLEAGSAATAREQLASGAVDVVVLDVGLPGESGLSLLGSFSALPSAVGVVVLTGSSDRRDMSSALALGALGYLRKSADELTVEAQIEIALLHVRAERERLLGSQRLQGSLAAALSRWDNLPANLAQGLFSAWDLRHIETGAHVRRIGVFSELLAAAVGDSPREARALGEAAVLHDIGKLAIPDSVLCKPSQLTDQEFQLMKRHTVEGAKMLAPIAHPFFERAASIALRHHERWDGSGYPDGLRGEETPLDARIVAVVDVYDALGEERCYKPAWSELRIVEFFRSRAGRQFEAPLVEALLDSLQRLKESSLEVAESGSLAVAPEVCA